MKTLIKSVMTIILILSLGVQLELTAQEKTKGVSQDIAKQHNQLMFEFFGSYLKQTKSKLSFDVDFLYEELKKFLAEKGIKLIFTKSQLVSIASDPRAEIIKNFKDNKMKNFLLSSIERINNIKDIQGLDKEIKLLRNELKKFNDKDNLFIATVYTDVLEASQKLYSNKEFIKHLDEFYQNATQTQMKRVWKVVAMCAADAVGAGIGALAGANQVTIVGGAVSVSGFATKLLEEK